MHIKFKSLELHNFMSFGNAYIDLNKSGFTFVSGKNEMIDDNSKSNGSGKSSIWEAISWVLTGETIRGTKDIVNMYLNEDAEVKLFFDSDDDEYVITRFKKAKSGRTSFVILKNGEDVSGKGVKDSEKALLDLIPDLTPLLIGSVILLGQGMPIRFSNNTPSGRKEILEKLSKSDFMVEDLKERISQRKIFLNESLRKIEDTILSLQSKDNTLDVLISNHKSRLASMSNLDDISKDISELSKYVEQYKELIDTIEKEITHQTNLMSKYTDEKFELVNKYTVDVNNLDKEYNPTYKKLYDEYHTIKANKDNIEKQIKDINSITTVCPTCGQTLIGVEKPSTVELEKALDAEIKNCCDAYNKLENYQSVYNSNKSKLETEFENNSKELNNHINEINSKLNELKTNLINSKRELSIKIELFEAAEREKAEYFTTIKHLENEIELNETERCKISQDIMYNINERDNISERLEIVNKMSLMVAREFRGHLLSDVIAYIQTKICEYANIVFKTDKINIVIEGNNLNIYYNGKLYENLSGGERQKIDLMLQFAIRDMLCKFSNFSSNIIVLDEIFDNLDSTGCQRILDLITNTLTDVDNIYIVTHHSNDLHIPYDSELFVVKDINGISRIVQ